MPTAEISLKSAPIDRTMPTILHGIKSEKSWNSICDILDRAVRHRTRPAILQPLWSCKLICAMMVFSCCLLPILWCILPPVLKRRLDCTCGSFRSIKRDEYEKQVEDLCRRVSNRQATFQLKSCYAIVITVSESVIVEMKESNKQTKSTKGDTPTEVVIDIATADSADDDDTLTLGSLEEGMLGASRDGMEMEETGDTGTKILVDANGNIDGGVLGAACATLVLLSFFLTVFHNAGNVRHTGITIMTSTVM